MSRINVTLNVMKYKGFNAGICGVAFHKLKICMTKHHIQVDQVNDYILSLHSQIQAKSKCYKNVTKTKYSCQKKDN